MDADARGLLDDAGADLEQARPEGRELGPGERHLAGHGIAQGEHQPVGRGVQDEAELVGDRALAGGPVGGELALVQLDEVLGLAAGAVDIFIEMAGVSAERGDDVAGVEAARGGLQPGDDPAFAVPRTGGVVEGVEAPHLFGAGLGAAHLEVVGDAVCDLHCGGMDTDEPLPAFLRREYFLDITVGVVACEDHPLLAGTPTAADLADCRWIDYDAPLPAATVALADPDRPSSLDRLLDGLFRETGRRVSTVLRARAAGLCLMATGSWLAWLPLNFLERLTGPQLRPLPTRFGRQRFLTAYRGPFDGFHATEVAVSKTCLVRFDNNQYSVAARAVGRPVDVRAYADRIVIRQDGEIVAEHPRSFGRGRIVYDPWHYVPILTKKPGALRNGAPFKGWQLPNPLGRLRTRLSARDDGDRQFVKVLAAVLEDGLEAVEAACAEALDSGACSADVVLNILARRCQPAPPATIPTPEGLRLRHQPVADCRRYDRLRGAGHGAS